MPMTSFDVETTGSSSSGRFLELSREVEDAEADVDSAGKFKHRGEIWLFSSSFCRKTSGFDQALEGSRLDRRFPFCLEGLNGLLSGLLLLGNPSPEPPSFLLLFLL